MRLEISLRRYWSNKEEALSKRVQIESDPSCVGQRLWLICDLSCLIFKTNWNIYPKFCDPKISWLLMAVSPHWLEQFGRNKYPLISEGVKAGWYQQCGIRPLGSQNKMGFVRGPINITCMVSFKAIATSPFSLDFFSVPAQLRWVTTIKH